MSTYKLNFTLTNDIQRTQYISSICTSTEYTQKQLTQMADYILLGNNTTSISTIVYPEEFTSPHVIHEEQSLDELMEDPIFYNTIESQIQPISRSIYKKNIRKIDRNNLQHKSIPGMKELWESIDYYKELYSKTKNYKVHNLLISLYKQQYILLENYIPSKPLVIHTDSKKEFFPWYTGIPLENGDYADLDLTIPNHMAKFLIHYPNLIDYCTDLNSDLAQLLIDVNAAFARTSLTPLQQDILTLYQTGKTIKYMQDYIKQKYNRQLGQAYISIILYNQIAPKLCTEYSEIYYSRIYKDNSSKWRICLCCKQKKLLTKHNFHHYSNKPNGFSLICKECTIKNKKKVKNAK